MIYYDVYDSNAFSWCFHRRIVHIVLLLSAQISSGVCCETFEATNFHLIRINVYAHVQTTIKETIYNTPFPVMKTGDTSSP